SPASGTRRTHRPPCLPSFPPPTYLRRPTDLRELAADLRVVLVTADLELDRAEVQQVRVDATLVHGLEVEVLHVLAELPVDAVLVAHRVRVPQIALLEILVPADVPEQLVDAVHPATSQVWMSGPSDPRTSAVAFPPTLGATGGRPRYPSGSIRLRRGPGTPRRTSVPVPRPPASSPSRRGSRGPPAGAPRVARSPAGPAPPRGRRVPVAHSLRVNQSVNRAMATAR